MRGSSAWARLDGTAIDAETKLNLTFPVGSRDAGTATEFVEDVAIRIEGRIQLTTDGHGAYLTAVQDAFGRGVDYAKLIKIYGASQEAETRYSPAVCLVTKRLIIRATPRRTHLDVLCRAANLSMRMSVRRFTRLTNAFSKKLENHVHAIALHFMHYNSCRIHRRSG